MVKDTKIVLSVFDHFGQGLSLNDFKYTLRFLSDDVFHQKSYVNLK